ncbi:pilus assembly protein [Pseudaminobacter sp. 19-2017]|uniref:Pilus assembly protein n=1 Tax=Pseudaminobacter soli (ex Zhang et al. 2022) TaxID=2831468 RepID=A0A942DZQ3_9HYPH|nr:TadE/TadG family type IV pilus assembly protein [Pseudaminobacter soli]MBS3648100.1 pilus assembly protein [Pseudaminobacter soli]
MVGRRLRAFLRERRGYVAVLTLISMPMLLGLSLLVIDVGRGNNLHTDLQNAVDALALAGARELDGGSDAITRAQAAISNLVKNQARFSNGGAAIIDAGQVRSEFLKKIPPSDDTAIDDTWITGNRANSGAEAAYVFVRANRRPMTALFPVPVGMNGTVNVEAEAVATYDLGACDVTPLFICNPFEGLNPSLKDQFTSGQLYARQITLVSKGNNTAGPGNFGFLRVGAGQGGSDLGKALATGHAETCYSLRGLDTEPGGNWGQVDGLNTRFDVYEGNFKQNKGDYAYRPARNIRKGATDTSGNKACDSYTEQTDATKAMALPEGTPTQSFTGGGTLHSNNWTTELKNYWKINHPAHVVSGVVQLPSIPTPSYPGAGTPPTPSRYDIYNYEIQKTLAQQNPENLLGDPNYPNPAGHRAPNGERGSPQCYTGLADQGGLDRRVIFAAVVNCNAAGLSGQTQVPASAIEGFMTMFLTKPVMGSNQKKISMEIVDFTGYSGSDTLDMMIRQEAYLVR